MTTNINTGTLLSGHAMALSHIEIRATVIIIEDPHTIESVTLEGMERVIRPSPEIPTTHWLTLYMILNQLCVV